MIIIITSIIFFFDESLKRIHIWNPYLSFRIELIKSIHKKNRKRREIIILNESKSKSIQTLRDQRSQKKNRFDV